MHTKKLIEYGVLAILGWFVLSWLLRAVEGVAGAIGNGLSPAQVYQPGVFYDTYTYGGDYGGSRVRWAPPPRRGGYNGRRPGTGGY